MAQVEQRRLPRTDATVAQLLARYLDEWDGSEDFGKTLRAYVRNHVDPKIGAIKAYQLSVEDLDSFYRELRRCRVHWSCSGTAPVACSLGSIAASVGRR